ncbi:hypothetical protein [Phaffia rhodozyma]|uniref:Uncharacterized protein n=1 Tax=Phaffia rhodozyma TaxID=264483 RepID=A0A0F7SVD4_PHARH|nr:hypothetical protein [Phaffia rhodozyma]
MSAPQLFTPVNTFNMDDPRSWASEIAMMDWDTTQICFTKRNLINFLRNVGISVGTNFTEVNKLPKHATFGRLSVPPASTGPIPSSPSPTDMEVDLAKPNPAAFKSEEPTEPAVGSVFATSDMRPTRRVRDPPEGKQTFRFGDDDEVDASVHAPPRSQAVPPTPSHPHYTHDPASIKPAATPTPHSNMASAAITTTANIGSVSGSVDDPVNVGDSRGGWKPTRRVRHGPGGPSSMGAMLGGYDDTPASDPSSFRTGKKQSSRPGETGSSDTWGPL